MIKDLLKSLNSIHNDNNLSLEEKFLLTLLIKYHNHELNYAYPSYEVLMTECSTNRKAKISKIVKSLSEKEYITIKKTKGNKSLYFLNKHLYYVETNESTDSNIQKQPKKKTSKVGIDSNGSKALPNQISVEEALQACENKELTLVDSIIETTGCNTEVAQASIDYAKAKGAKNLKAYAIASIKNGFGASASSQDNTYRGNYTSNNSKRFNNFEPRDGSQGNVDGNMTYEEIEAQLLGWYNDESEDIEEIQESTSYDFLTKYGIGLSVVN